jgi:hypothetical protein
MERMATADETTVGGSVFITVSCGGTIGGDRAVPIGEGSFFIYFFSSSSSTLFPFLSRARAGGPFSRGTAVEKKDGPGRFFGLYPHSASSYAFRFDSYSLIYIYFFFLVFFFVNIYNEIFITSY